MRRTVSAHLELDVLEPAVLALLVAVADGAYERTDRLAVTCDGRLLDVTGLAEPHGTRMHRVQAPVGRLIVDYDATVVGTDRLPAANEHEAITYLRPSRYAESDRLIGLANVEFAGLSGTRLLSAVGQWVEAHVAYVAGSSAPTDGAVDTLLSGSGVCRDFAHLTVSLLRSMDMPARLVAVYAPGLMPMDFHAVAEALLDDVWHVIDATHLAPRGSMLRISTGRDAADTAFLSTHHGQVTLLSQEVTATVDGDLPIEDWSEVVELR
ncbi:transglutaminase-like domain-containing protein [Pengzhenrongella frigida]|uniref:Transglutaminase family protein n=1 Tax=Pengzhenrongella frigida TaxID=1259133 RepID=A0A4Q5N3V9_9MICO|nr:transglutaminase family protein [Cellulomonas sp. HLT2-17]RYV51327.1 transglutaminase family protein [Cellulomonas sp. HLT2-17]